MNPGDFSLNPYILPPALTLLMGSGIAVLALSRGPGRDRLLFALVCLGWSLLSPVYIAHQLINDEILLLHINRGVGFLYVFFPFVNLLFFHQMFGFRSRKVEIGSFIISALLAPTTLTDLFYHGMRRFSWGTIVEAGPCFDAFALYGAAATVYGLLLVRRRMNIEQNKILRLKVKYIFMGIITGALLTFANIPALHGFDLYPLGNFSFIPLGLMAYGILRHRLLEIPSILRLSLMWGVISSLILIPNTILFFSLFDTLLPLHRGYLFLLGTVWFYLNYLYLRKIQPVIDRAFHRQEYDLKKAESHLINEILILKSPSTLQEEFAGVVCAALKLKYAELYLRVRDSMQFSGHSLTIEINPNIEEWFRGANHLAEKNMVATNPYYAYIRDAMLRFFAQTGCHYVVPLMQNESLLGLLLLGEKETHKLLNSKEIAFLNNVRAAGSIALSNSAMYQDLSDLKDNLEQLVAHRTRELQQKNDQMVFELRLARTVQQSLLPIRLPREAGVRIAAKVVPMMEVSGDFYQVSPFGPSSLAISIVDVSGHGLPAALLTAMISMEIDNELTDTDDTARICTAISERLASALSESGSYFTMFLGILDLSLMRMTYTNCGHVCPVLMKRTGGSQLLSTVGLIMGTAIRGTFESRTISLEAGDRICLYTDGVTETFDPAGIPFGEERLIRSLEETLPLTIEEQIESILQRLHAYRGNQTAIMDDVTVMMVEMEGQP